MPPSQLLAAILYFLLSIFKWFSWTTVISAQRRRFSILTATFEDFLFLHYRQNSVPQVDLTLTLLFDAFFILCWNKRICTISSGQIYSPWYMAKHIWLHHMFDPEDAHCTWPIVLIKLNKCEKSGWSPGHNFTQCTHGKVSSLFAWCRLYYLCTMPQFTHHEVTFPFLVLACCAYFRLLLILL